MITDAAHSRDIPLPIAREVHEKKLYSVPGLARKCLACVRSLCYHPSSYTILTYSNKAQPNTLKCWHSQRDKSADCCAATHLHVPSSPAPSVLLDQLHLAFAVFVHIASSSLYMTFRTSPITPDRYAGSEASCNDPLIPPHRCNVSRGHWVSQQYMRRCIDHASPRQSCGNSYATTMSRVGQ